MGLGCCSSSQISCPCFSFWTLKPTKPIYTKWNLVKFQIVCSFTNTQGKRQWRCTVGKRKTPCWEWGQMGTPAKVLIQAIPAPSEDAQWKDMDFAVCKHRANKSLSFFFLFFSKERGPVSWSWKTRVVRESSSEKLSLFLSPVQCYL